MLTSRWNRTCNADGVIFTKQSQMNIELAIGEDRRQTKAVINIERSLSKTNYQQNDWSWLTIMSDQYVAALLIPSLSYCVTAYRAYKSNNRVHRNTATLCWYHDCNDRRRCLDNHQPLKSDERYIDIVDDQVWRNVIVLTYRQQCWRWSQLRILSIERSASIETQRITDRRDDAGSARAKERRWL